MPARPAFAIKAGIDDSDAAISDFAAQKTMYGGKGIAMGDTVFLFASETRGGRGPVARGIVTAAVAVPRLPGVTRQTPRVSIAVARTATATRALGRAALSRFTNRDDGAPETELNDKLYRQATDKIVGLSPAAAAFLKGCCREPPAVATPTP